MLLYCIWLEVFGQKMVDYLPVLIYTLLVMQEILDENNLVSIS